jgi:hypothetical protein
LKKMLAISRRKKKQEHCFFSGKFVQARQQPQIMLTPISGYGALFLNALYLEAPGDHPSGGGCRWRQFLQEGVRVTDSPPLPPSAAPLSTVFYRLAARPGIYTQYQDRDQY